MELIKLKLCIREWAEDLLSEQEKDVNLEKNKLYLNVTNLPLSLNFNFTVILRRYPSNENSDDESDPSAMRSIRRTIRQYRPFFSYTRTK